MRLRAPAVAGTFYPAEAGELSREVAQHLRTARKRGVPLPHAPKGLIVPHAGYIYSAGVAAHAFGQLCDRAEHIRRVILIGPAHRQWVPAPAAPSCAGFATPLGSVPLDVATLGALRDRGLLCFSDEAHAEEHCLEVQLPFLQSILGDFQLLPILLSDPSRKQVAELLRELWGGPETLILVSSDLSHYEGYDSAQQHDTHTRRYIETLQEEPLTPRDACGSNAIGGLLALAREEGLRLTTLDMRNSGDTSGDRSRVVGYGAWSVETEQDARLADPLRRQLLDIAARSLAHGCRNGAPPPPPGEPPGWELDNWRSCFVSLHKNGALRGCIGSFDLHRPLHLAVAQNAWSAAFEDARFPPLSEKERKDTTIHITVLGAKRLLAAASEKELLEQLLPGEDGILLEETGAAGGAPTTRQGKGSKAGGKGSKGRARPLGKEEAKCATFLPAVWEQLPEPRAFLQALRRKAGLPEDYWSDTLRIHRYRCEQFGTRELSL